MCNVFLLLLVDPREPATPTQVTISPGEADCGSPHQPTEQRHYMEDVAHTELQEQAATNQAHSVKSSEAAAAESLVTLGELPTVYPIRFLQ